MTTDQFIGVASIVVGVAATWFFYRNGKLQEERLQAARDGARKSEQFEIRLESAGCEGFVDPFPHSEIYMKLAISVTNIGECSVFLESVSLSSSDENGLNHYLFFSADKVGIRELCPGEKFAEYCRLGVLHKSFPGDEPAIVAGQGDRQVMMNFLRRVCVPEAFVRVETTRKTHDFPASTVCAGPIEHWSRYFPTLNLPSSPH